MILVSLSGAGRKTLVHRAAGNFPAIFLCFDCHYRESGDKKMLERVLSVFIDESGDFGSYDYHAPYYLVTMVLHDQSIDISANIDALEDHMRILGYEHHAIHTGPLIRRESVYLDDKMEDRVRLFNSLFHFARKLDFKYICVKIKKSECPDVITMTAKLSKAIADAIRSGAEFWGQYDRVIVYYDNGQMELTKILTSVFSTLYAHVEFRKVKPVDYKLFQVADLVCTMELLEEKANSNCFTKSEKDFFGSPRDFKKNQLKHLKKKLL